MCLFTVGESMSHDTLYYDGQCPLCSTEMEKLGSYADSDLKLVDIHSLEDDTGLPTKDALLTSLHLKQADGDLLRGLDANVAAWQHTRFGPYVRWLRWPLVKLIADWVYDCWARLRYRRLYGTG
jgi:predicted DCC family thiol-disulfide oxidoreductase YuxK